MSIRENIRDGKYENKIPYSRKSDPVNDDMTIKQARDHERQQKELKRKQRELYYAEESRMGDLFRNDLEEEYGIAGHPKADALFSLAWRHGHSGGYDEVLNYYDEFVELVK